MSIDLYNADASPFCRSVRLTAEALGIKLNLIKTNIHEENPHIRAINPMHTLPTLVDGDLKLWESRAIMTYLASQYGKNDQLYPKDLKKRAHVDRLLYFDIGTLNAYLWAVMAPMIQKKVDKPDEDSVEKFKKTLGFLNTFLEGNSWVDGSDHYTLADIAIVVTLSALKEAGFTFTSYPNVKVWMERCEKEFPGYAEVNIPGAKVLASRISSDVINWNEL